MTGPKLNEHSFVAGEKTGTKAVARWVRMSASKARPILDLIRDKDVQSVVGYLSKATDTVEGVKPASPQATRPFVSSLPGIVIDETQAKLTGKWGDTGSLSPFVGEGYRYASPGEKSEARFTFKIKQAGKYELRFAWAPHENRATKATCILERKGQNPLKIRINQRDATTDPNGFHSLGRFDLPEGESTFTLTSEGADGLVHADALQILEVK